MTESMLKGWLIFLLILSLGVFVAVSQGCEQSVAPVPENASSSPAEAIPQQCRIYAVQLDNPTYVQMVEFLKRDACERCGENCVDRAECLVKSAYAAGYECYVVTLNDTDGNGHVIVAFNTTDRGFIYIEPFYDLEVTVEIGKDYGEQLNEPGFIVEQIGVFP